MDQEPLQDSAEDVKVVRAPARRRRAAKRKRRATSVISILTVVFVAGAITLGITGWRATLKITGGRQTEVRDPAAPGYSAEVRPTEVELLALTTDSGELATMLLMVGAQKQAEPVVVPISSGLTLWSFEDGEPTVAIDLYREAGLDVLTLRLGVDLGFGITSSAEMPLAKWNSAFHKIGPVTIDLPDSVNELNEHDERVTRYQAGEITLQPDEVAPFLAFRGYGEAETNRALRLRLLWEAILPGIPEVPEVVDPDGQGEKGLPLLAAIGGADASATQNAQSNGPSFELLPIKAVILNTDPPIQLDRIDIESMDGWTARYVPFPTSAFPGQRVVVNLLNGTSDPGVLQSTAPKIVTAGGTIGLTGNAMSFDIATTTVTYVMASIRSRAEEIARQLGTSAHQTEVLPSGVDVEVTIGSDLL